MARDRRRVRYDQDATVITESTGMADDISVQKENGNIGARMPVLDAIDTLAAYLLPRFDIKKDPSITGTCVMCGNDTAYVIRHLCVDCMERIGNDFYLKTKAAVEAKESEVIL